MSSVDYAQLLKTLCLVAPAEVEEADEEEAFGRYTGSSNSGGCDDADLAGAQSSGGRHGRGGPNCERAGPISVDGVSAHIGLFPRRVIQPESDMTP
jgi:hypothetical protein